MQIEKTDSTKITEELNSTHPWADCKPVQVGRFSIGGPSFTVIAGPCSIESESQFLETAQGVYALGARLVRGGIWKLRTNPNSFQGLGKSGFHFIKEICARVDMPLVSEITDPRQIEHTLDLVDVIQVGSRNMHNYELLKELGKTDKPILLKRGFAAHVSEWLNAAEYILKGGNDKIILCERGIRTFETSTRNTLDLNAVVYLKKNTPFPVVVDPSHAVGVRSLVSSLALASAAAGADGIIVEVHPRPHEALSDGMQALTLRDFELMMKKLELILAAIDKPLVK
jgi:3-deoxy-7-phosphoheptulonate synthase